VQSGFEHRGCSVWLAYVRGCAQEVLSTGWACIVVLNTGVFSIHRVLMWGDTKQHTISGTQQLSSWEEMRCSEAECDMLKCTLYIICGFYDQPKHAANKGGY